MKKFRKLVPALCMLLISAVLLGTSTFAWFSMNTTVTATGMQVTAKTNHTYLLISKTNDKVALQTDPDANDTKVTYEAAASKLAPSAHDAFETTGASTAAATVGKWFTAQGSDPSKSDMKTDTKKTLTNFDGYVLTETVYITVTKDSADAKNLKVKATITNNTAAPATDIAPLKVLVVCGDNYVEFDSTELEDASKVLAATISKDVLTKVDIYIYYDGNHANVTTNNAANLGGAKVDLTFSVDN